MNKVKTFLEQYVQYVALAAGALFLLWIIRGYVLTNPLERTLSVGKTTETVAPGSIDTTINDTLGKDIRELSGGSHPEFTLAIDAGANVSVNQPQTRPAIAVNWNTWAVDESSLINDSHGPASPLLQSTKVAQLPTLPPLGYVDNETLRTVIFSDPTNPASHQDVDAITTFWRLPIAALDKEFTAAFAGKLTLPQEQAMFARAVVTRQQQQPDGTWGAEAPIQQANNGLVPPVSYDVAASNAKDGQTYSTWIQTTPSLVPAILACPFPAIAVARADLVWQPLETYLPQRAAQQAALNPPPAASVVKPVGLGIAPPAVAAPAVVIPKLQAVPPAPFSTTAIVAGGDLCVFFHDLSAEPGQVYRYRVRYTLFNPVYTNSQIVTDPKFALQLGIDSPLSEWSGAITVPARSRFWCSPKQPTTERDHHLRLTSFMVFTWHDGLWRMHDYPSLSPGDEIGSDEGDAGNFITHNTYLDQRPGGTRGENFYAYVTADDGSSAWQRELSNDLSGPDYKTFKTMYDAQIAGTPNAVPAPPIPGTPIMPAPGTATPGRMGNGLIPANEQNNTFNND